MEKKTEEITLTYHYTFLFPDGRKKEFRVGLDPQTLSLKRHSNQTPPRWARLENHKCSVCPFDEKTHPYCPVAVSLEELIDFFKDSISYEEVDVIIETPARTYTKKTSLQKGVSSLLGIYMVTTGCTVMERLKPMVRFHLPFATPEETIYRVVSMYLLSQYFKYRKGMKPDWHMQHLVKIYNDIKVVNQAFFGRLNALQLQDASLNALAILHNFANYVTFSIDENMLHKIELLFDAYLDDASDPGPK